MMIAVRPASSPSTARSISRSVAGSRRDEASSRITSAGSRSMTRVNASSCASPADRPDDSTVFRPAGSALYHSSSPSCARAAWMRSSGMPSSNSVRFCRSVALNICTSCVTIPTARRSSRVCTPRMSTPPSRMAPPVGSYSRASSRATVVLPLPVRPNSPSTRPGASVKSSPRSTRSSTSCTTPSALCIDAATTGCCAPTDVTAPSLRTAPSGLRTAPKGASA